MAEVAPILVLDFDGVLHSYTSPWTGPAQVNDGPVPGAVDFLLEASKSFNLCVLSSRSHESGGQDAMAQAVVSWITEESHLPCKSETQYVGGLSMEVVVSVADEVSEEGGVYRKVVSFPRHKPPAFLTIDDRAWTFTGVWPSMDMLYRFKPWNRR